MRMNYKFALIVAVTSIFGIAIAYAALSTSLTVTANKVTQNALSWNVGFVTGTVTATAGGTSSTGRTCGSATVAATSVTVADTTLSKPDDSCLYKLQVTNAGGIAASLGSVTPTKPTSTTCGTASGGTMVCGNITYKLTTDASSSTVVSSSNFSLAAGATKDLYLLVKYTGTSVNSSAVTQSAGKFTLVFNQA